MGTGEGDQGHAIGGDVGAVIAGIDERVDVYVLDATGLYTQILVDMTRYGEGPPADDLPAYQDGVAMLNATEYLGHNRNASFLAQLGKVDTWNQEGRGEAVYESISGPKTLKWYSGDVMLGCPQKIDCDPSLPAFAFHREWLQKNL